MLTTRPGTALRLPVTWAGGPLSASIAGTVNMEGQINSRLVRIHASHPNTQVIAKPERASCAFTLQSTGAGFEMVVVARQAGDMDEAVHKNITEHYKQAKMRDTGNHTVQRRANVLLHEQALAAGLNVPGRLVGSPLLHGSRGTQLLGGRYIYRKGRWLTAVKQVAYPSMHDQIGVAPDR
jgi:hypothetical protein